MINLSSLIPDRWAVVPILLFGTTVVAQSFSAMASGRPSTVYGDFNGFWQSNSNKAPNVVANNTNNLLGFTIGAKAFSTGVDDAKLTANGISFISEKYVAFPVNIQKPPVNAASLFVGIPHYLNGVKQEAATLSCDQSLSSFLRDGKQGLDLGTAVFNIPVQELSFYVNVLADINPSCINDDIPDIIVTQMGQPAGSFDVFKFTDINGNTIGVEQQVKFSDVDPVGRAQWTFYKAAECPYQLETGGSFFGTNRDTRILTFKLSDFGITQSNFQNAVRFVQVLSGASDVAFSAYSANSLSLYCLEDANKTGIAKDTKVGITALNRAGSTADNWPMVRKGGHLALESKDKPFVITRLSTAELTNIAAPVTGMMVYDTTVNCLKIYIDSTNGWKCFNRKTCP